jgi:hypothetical protein
MLPAVYGILKAATWAQRGIIAGIIVGVITLVFGWGYIKGSTACKEKQAKEMLAQSIEVNKHEAKKAESLATIDERHDAKGRKSDEQSKVVTHEIIRYVHDPNNKPCVLDPEYQRLVGRVEQLQRDTESHLSHANPAPTQTDGLPATAITTHQLLQGLEQLANARRKDLEVIQFTQDWERERFKDEMGFYANSHDVQMQAFKEHYGDVPQ